eukprot:759281-Hanusia_phi.AAC.5
MLIVCTLHDRPAYYRTESPARSRPGGARYGRRVRSRILGVTSRGAYVLMTLMRHRVRRRRTRDHRDLRDPELRNQPFTSPSGSPGPGWQRTRRRITVVPGGSPPDGTVRSLLREPGPPIRRVTDGPIGPGPGRYPAYSVSDRTVLRESDRTGIRDRLTARRPTARTGHGFRSSHIESAASRTLARRARGGTLGRSRARRAAAGSVRGPGAGSLGGHFSTSLGRIVANLKTPGVRGGNTIMVGVGWSSKRVGIQIHHSKEIVSRTIEDPHKFHRYTYSDWGKRTKRMANSLKELGVTPGDRVATIAWNGYRHFELYYAISGGGAILHTINPRLSADQLAYIINHAEDKVKADR